MTTAKKRPTPPASAKGRSATTRAAKTSTGKAATGKAATGTAATQPRSAARRGPQPPAKKKFPILPVVFVGVALALIAAIVFSSNESINSGNETGEPELTGEALPPYDSGAEPANDGGVGAAAPAVTGEGFDGSPVSITPDDGTPRAVVFLAHWCPHCQAEVPRIQQWLDEGGGVEGVELMSVTTSVNSAQPNYPPSEWLEREGWTPENLLDNSDNEVYTAYGGGAFPFFVFIDGDGNVVRRASGELDIATLEAYMREAAE